MECDSMHSIIERKTKNQSLFVAFELLNLTQSVRPSQPYVCFILGHKFIKEFKLLSYGDSIRPEIKSGDPEVRDIRGLKYADGTISYTLPFDYVWSLLPQRGKKVEAKEPDQVYSRKL